MSIQFQIPLLVIAAVAVIAAPDFFSGSSSHNSLNMDANGQPLLNPDVEHTYPPGYPELNQHYQAHIEQLFQMRISTLEEGLQRQLALERAEWTRQREESRFRELELEAQVEQLRLQLTNTQVKTTPPSANEMSSALPTTPVRYGTRSTTNSSRPATVNTPSPARRGAKKGPTQRAANTVPVTSPPAHNPVTPLKPVPSPKSTPRKPPGQVYRLREQDVPEDARTLKRALELHVRILWGAIEANAAPPLPEPTYVAAFQAKFSDDTNLTDVLMTGHELVSRNLVKIGSSISVATRKKIALDAKHVEELILQIVSTFIVKFGLIRWCPDLDQTAYSTYNSACRLVALDTFKQALIAHAYDHIGPATKYANNMDLLIKLYDHFVHHHMYELYKKEVRQPGSVQASSEKNPQYVSRRRLADARREFLSRNKYPQRYIDLITTKATSDDEADKDGLEENRRPVFYIKRRPERSAMMERFIRILDAKREEELLYSGKRGARRDRIRRVPENQEVTKFLTLPDNMPVDYFDPQFFNNLQPHMRKSIASRTIALLPQIEDSLTRCADERLSDEAFTDRYGKDVFTRYELGDLDEFDGDDEWLDDDEDIYVDVGDEGGEPPMEDIQ